MRQCKILKISRNMVAVSYSTERGDLEGRLLTRDDLSGGAVTVGATVDVPDEVLDNGIEYGLDFEVIIDQVSFSAKTLQNALRNAGIWTLGDLTDNTQKAISILQSLLGATVGMIRRKAIELYGGDMQ